MRTKVKLASDVARRAQRNWDLSKDIPYEERRTGEDDKPYRFPTFEGVTDVYINGVKR